MIQPRSETVKKYFIEPSQTVEIKGFLTVMVILSHLYGRISLFRSSLLGAILTAFGYLAVAGFFFLSGFGIQEQSQRSEDYDQQFGRRKIVPFYLAYLLTLVIYIIFGLLNGRKIAGTCVLLGIICAGGDIIENGWYLQVQLLLYCVFFADYILWVKAGLNRVSTCMLVCALYCGFCFFLKVPSTWYESIFAFLVGRVISINKDKVKRIIDKNLKFYLLFGIFMFAGTLILGNRYYLPELLRIIMKMVSAISFSLLIIAMYKHIRHRSKVKVLFSSIGKYSFEVYIIQGVFLIWYRQIIANDCLYMLTVIISTGISACLIHPLYGFIFRGAYLQR